MYSCENHVYFFKYLGGKNLQTKTGTYRHPSFFVNGLKLLKVFSSNKDDYILGTKAHLRKSKNRTKVSQRAPNGKNSLQNLESVNRLDTGKNSDMYLDWLNRANHKLFLYSLSLTNSSNQMKMMKIQNCEKIVVLCLLWSLSF